MTEFKMSELRTFSEFFDPHNREHVKAALHYFTYHQFPDGFIPDNVVLCNPYGIDMHIYKTMTAAWISAVLNGTVKVPTTH